MVKGGGGGGGILSGGGCFYSLLVSGVVGVDFKRGFCLVVLV